MSLPDLPGSDTATVTANEVAGSGCQVTIEIADTSDPRGGQPGMIGIDLTLPDSWNGNYMAEGGGVYCGPASFVTLAGDQWLAAGYAVSPTRLRAHRLSERGGLAAGHQSGSHSASATRLNWNRIDDFGYLSFHLEAVESKLVIDRYYANRAQYAFWDGCSTGGRQGLSEAEKYPTDFNGILAGAPALNWDQFMVAQMWPQLVMEWSGDELPTCKEKLVNATLQAQCRDQDGRSTACSTRGTAT
jgi:Tannase and feruloyl esterase